MNTSQLAPAHYPLPGKVQYQQYYDDGEPAIITIINTMPMSNSSKREQDREYHVIIDTPYDYSPIVYTRITAAGIKEKTGIDIADGQWHPETKLPQHA